MRAGEGGSDEDAEPHDKGSRPPAIPKPKCCGGRWNGCSIVHTDDCEKKPVRREPWEYFDGD